jgi:hypothetical protein
MEILELVDQLDAMVRHARKMPITGRAMIDAERLKELIDQMRLTIPLDIQSARDVLDRREQIVSQTMLDARRMRATAEVDARALVEESELMKSAKKRSDEVMSETANKAERLLMAAEAEARHRLLGADQYGQDSLANLEEQVLNLLNVIHAGQRVLSPAEETEKEQEQLPEDAASQASAPVSPELTA